MLKSQLVLAVSEFKRHLIRTKQWPTPLAASRLGNGRFFWVFSV